MNAGLLGKKNAVVEKTLTVWHENDNNHKHFDPWKKTKDAWDMVGCKAPVHTSE